MWRIVQGFAAVGAEDSPRQRMDIIFPECINFLTHTHTRTFTYIFLSICISINNVYVYIYIYIYICIYIYTYILEPASNSKSTPLFRPVGLAIFHGFRTLIYGV